MSDVEGVEIVLKSRTGSAKPLEVIDMVGQASTSASKPRKATGGKRWLEQPGFLLYRLGLLLASGILLLYLRPYLNQASLEYAAAAAVKSAREHTTAALAISHVVFGLATLRLLLWLYGKRPVYLMDFYCFRPPNHLAGSNEDFLRGAALTELFNEQSMDFMRKILDMSGLSQATFLSQEIRNGAFSKFKPTFDGAKAETELALFTCIEKVLAATHTKPHEIDALIINCSNWTPVPSLASAVINHFKMKSSILSYNLSGMGCTATVIATGMAQEMLQNHKNMRVLIASTENTTNSVYLGNQRSMMITNMIFKYGGVAFLLSNRAVDRRRAKYQLSHVVRTHLGADDTAYRCVYQQADEEGNRGVKIGKELMEVAGRAMKVNIRALAPLVLPASEKLKYAVNMFQRKVLKKRIPEYSPDFTAAFEHFCIHTGGKAVIDSVEKALKFRPEQGEPCRAAFHQYGNTSGASTWYNWSYIETRQGVKRGDRVWQLAFGSGFKCCSAVWRSLRPINDQHDAWTGTPSCPASACYPASTIPERYFAPDYKLQP